jgi:AcrR family transcriptional regulator
MPRDTTFTKAMVIEAASALVTQEGAAALSARNVAARLKASTAPIYASFGSIEALREAVVEEARKALRTYTLRPWSDRPFLNEGAGLVMFALEKPRLFALLFLDPDSAKESVPRVYRDLLKDMKGDERFAKLGARQRDVVLEKLWFMALGMATLAHAGQLRNPTPHGIVESLLEAGAVLIPDALRRLASGPG